MRTQVISWNRLRTLLADRDFAADVLIVDVRDRTDYERGHFPHAVNIPYERIESGEGRLMNYRTLVFYCDHGAHSLMAAKRFARMGVTAYSILGGYQSKRD